LTLVRVDEDAVEEVDGLERKRKEKGKKKSWVRKRALLQKAHVDSRWTSTHDNQELCDSHTLDEISRTTHFCHNLREDHGSSVSEDHVEDTVL